MFIDSVQGANAIGNRFLKSMAPHRPQGIPSPTIEVESAKRGILIAEALLERRRDLNAHYGWVLASDAALVSRSMGGKRKHGAAWARQWMKSVYDEYERVGHALLDANVELKISVRRAESGCHSRI